MTGLARHHALHARICIERGRWWQAEHWIGAIRDRVITPAYSLPACGPCSPNWLAHACARRA